jgi:3-deoxy-D-manno-octulosonic-acid transferase
MTIETVAVSAIFRPSQLYFRWYGAFFRRALKRIHHFDVQNEESAELLKSIGIQQSTVSGDMRYKRVVQAKEMAMEHSNELLATFTTGTTTLIIGSSWQKEEGIVREAISELGATKLIIAPHDVSEQHISSIQTQFPNALRYTQLTFPNDERKLFDSQILIIDCIGQLSSAYRYATIAFIGGGFTGNLHNILEPAVYGLPLLFGPKHRKFPEAKLFLQKGFALEVTNPKDFSQAFNALLSKVTSLRPEMEKFVQAQA